MTTVSMSFDTPVRHMTAISQ